MTTFPNNHIGITVSPIAFNFRLGKSERLKGKLFASCPVTSGFTYELPPGKYEIIGLAVELSEEQWRLIVPRYDGDAAWIPSYNDPDSGGHGYCYEDYTNEDEHSVFYTATESGLSFIASKGLEGKTTLILKKVI